MKLKKKKGFNRPRYLVKQKIRFNCLKSPYRKFWAKRKSDNTWVYSSRLCHQWRCEYCGILMQAEFIKKVSRLIKSVPFKSFLTLTLDPKQFDFPVQKLITPTKTLILEKIATHSQKALMKIWSKFRKYLSREYGKRGKVKVIAVVEFQESWFAHLHVIVNKEIIILPENRTVA